MEYNFNSNIFFNNKIFQQKLANSALTINNTDNNDNDIKLLSDKYNKQYINIIALLIILY